MAPRAGIPRSQGVLLAVAVVQGGLALQARRQIGGATGDVLGAAQQLGEAVVLLVACANLSGGS